MALEKQQWIIFKLKSEFLDKGMYHPGNNTLIVTMKKGAQYKYYRVPQNIVNAFQRSESSGYFYNTMIKHKFDEEKLQAIDNYS